MATQDASYQPKKGHVIPEMRDDPTWQRRVWDWVLQRVWYVHTPIHLAVHLSPSDCYKLLGTVARPSAQRLHHGPLFANGRRYHLRPRDERNFQLTTTNTQFWNRRHRTSPTALIYGQFHTDDAALTQLILQARVRINVVQIMRALFWPAFLTSMIVLMPWALWLRGGLVLLLFAVAWLTFRLTAMLEAHEMIFFIGKALEDHYPDPPGQLPSRSAEIIYEHQRDFGEIWAKFYERMRDENDGAGTPS